MTRLTTRRNTFCPSRTSMAATPSAPQPLTPLRLRLRHSLRLRLCLREEVGRKGDRGGGFWGSGTGPRGSHAAGGGGTRFIRVGPRGADRERAAPSRVDLALPRLTANASVPLQASSKREEGRQGRRGLDAGAETPGWLGASSNEAPGRTRSPGGGAPGREVRRLRCWPQRRRQRGRRRGTSSRGEEDVSPPIASNRSGRRSPPNEGRAEGRQL